MGLNYFRSSVLAAAFVGSVMLGRGMAPLPGAAAAVAARPARAPLAEHLARTEASVRALDRHLAAAAARGGNQKADAKLVERARKLGRRHAKEPLGWSEYVRKVPGVIDVSTFQAEAAQRDAEKAAADLGDDLNVLWERRKVMEAERMVLWSRIAFRAVADRELSDQPLYRFELKGPAGKTPDEQRMAALRAAAQFVRVVDHLAGQAQEAVEADPPAIFERWHKQLAAARTRLQDKLLSQALLAMEVYKPATEAGQLAVNARQLSELAQSIVDAQRALAAAEKAEDDEEADASRAQLQQALADTAGAVAALDQSVNRAATAWGITGVPGTKAAVEDLPELAAAGEDGAPLVTLATSTPAVERPDRPANPRLALLKWKGTWQVRGDEIMQSETNVGFSAMGFGDPAWTDFDFTVDALRAAGSDHFEIGFRIDGDQKISYLIGRAASHSDSILTNDGHSAPKVIQNNEFGIQAGKWYTAKVRARGEHFICSLNDGDKELERFDFSSHHSSHGHLDLETRDSAWRFRNLKATSPDGRTLWEGLPDLPAAPPAPGASKGGTASPDGAVHLVPGAPIAGVGGNSGWVDLFKGNDLAGWDQAGDQGSKWQFQDGVVTGEGGARFGTLRTKRTDYRDFHLHFETVFSEHKNALLSIRAGSKAYNIYLPGTDPDERKAGEIYDNATREKDRKRLADAVAITLPNGTWYTVQVTAEGPHIMIAINGKQVVDFVDRGSPLLDGAIELRARGGSIAQFRNFWIQEVRAPVSVVAAGPARILSARFGGGNKWADVTQRVKQLMAAGASFSVNPASMGADPYPYCLKQMEIRYVKDGETKALIVGENDTVSPRDGFGK